MSVMRTELLGKSLGAHIDFNIDHEHQVQLRQAHLPGRGRVPKIEGQETFIRLVPSSSHFTKDIVASAQEVVNMMSNGFPKLVKSMITLADSPVITASCTDPSPTSWSSRHSPEKRSTRP
jgi:hypothetical protein